MTEPVRELLSSAASLLEQGRRVDHLSLALTAAALMWMLIYPSVAPKPLWVVPGFAVLIGVAGLLEIYFAIRVSFDAALFRQAAEAQGTPDFAAIDAALTRLGVLPAAKSGRPIDVRVDGARRLFRLQVLAFVAQVLLVFAGALLILSLR